MVKKNEKTITEGQLNNQSIKAKSSIIQDTSAPPLTLDVNAKDEDEKTKDGILTLQNQFPPRTNITCSFRIAKDLIEHFKQEARMLSLERNEDVNWQRLIVSAALEKYPIKD